MNRGMARGFAKEHGPGRNGVIVRRRLLHRAPGAIGVCLLVAIAASLTLVVLPGTVAASGQHCAVLKVPSQYPTIQSAINAAHPCDTILIGPGTYVEQLTIDTSISLVGAGPGSTIIQSPAVLTPDAFGNPWTIELGSGATVGISGVTVLVTPQCIIGALPVMYAGGGIGVGGSASLSLKSAVVTTTGATEGAACGGPSPTTAGIVSYGIGIAFGLDYVVGSPPVSALLGFGEVSGVTVSGFGYSGEDIAIGGHVNSPAGSYALISHDKVSIGADASGDFAAIQIGLAGNPCSATVVNSVVTASAATTGPDDLEIAFGSSAYVADNSLITGPNEAGVLVYYSSATNTILGNSITMGTAGAGILLWFSSASVLQNRISVGPYGTGIYGYYSSGTILYNTITGPTTELAWGVSLSGGSATISYNVIGQFECAYDATLSSEGLCGPSGVDQYQFPGIFAGYGGPYVATYNVIYSTDAGVYFDQCSPNCVAQGNVITNSYDFALAGVDGTYSFGPNVIIGGAYGVAAFAITADTTVTLSHVVIVNPSVAPFYSENDCEALWGYSCTVTINGS